MAQNSFFFNFEHKILSVFDNLKSKNKNNTFFYGFEKCTDRHLGSTLYY